MVMEITKTKDNGMKGNFTPKKWYTTKEEAERQYQKCLIDNKIDFLGWF